VTAVGDARLPLDVVELETSTGCEFEAETVGAVVEALLATVEAGDVETEDAFEDIDVDALDVTEDPIEDVLEADDGVDDTAVLDGGVTTEEEEGATDEDVGVDGGELELAPPLGTGTTTPPWSVPLAFVDVPAALDL
jgi:hypothetical protein